MSALSALIGGLPQEQRVANYDALAEVALRAFGVEAQEVTFLGHNSGAAFKVESLQAGRMLLKVHAPQGDGASLSPEAILGGLQWLALMAELTEAPVQAPLPDLDGDLLPSVVFRGMSLRCSLQRWLDGEQVEGLCCVVRSQPMPNRDLVARARQTTGLSSSNAVANRSTRVASTASS